MRSIFTRKTMLSLIVSLFASAYLYAQTQEATIKGKLTDEQSGEAIAGAIVFVKGTKTAVQSDADGNFEIKTTQPFPFSLSVSYVGYQPKEIEIYEEDQAVEFKIRSSAALSEVVVVGYGETKRSDFTGSIGTVAPELKTQPVPSFDRLLQGAVAGVNVTQGSGQPGSGPSIQIRGYNTIQAGTEPLYVIDGFPIYNDQSTNNAGVSQQVGPGSYILNNGGSASTQNPMSSLNPNDIESIDVLKDASATAIYGDRGSNGVIIITTKKGRAGVKPTISYDGYYGVQAPTGQYNLLNGSQFLSLRADAVQNSTNAPDQLLPAIQSTYPNYANTSTDWQKAIITPIHDASIQSHNLSVSAGDDKTRVAFSGNYFKQNGILLNTPYQRFSGRLNLDHDFNSALNVATYLTFSHSDAQVAPNGVVPAALAEAPIIPLNSAGTNAPSGNGYTLNTNPFTGTTYGNPVNSLLNDINTTRTDFFLGNVGGTYNFGKLIPVLNGLTAKVTLGANINQTAQQQYLPSTVYEGNPSNGIATIGNVYATNWLNENTLNYSKKIGKIHSFNAVAGFTQQNFNLDGSIVSSQNFLNDFQTFNNLGAGQIQNPSQSQQSAWVLHSFLGRVNYGYKEKYLVTATLRDDGSSKFADGHKYGIFPSGAVAWNAHNEDFIKQISQISQLKLRLSAGITGNSNIGAYNSIGQLTPNRYNFGGVTQFGFAPLFFNNPNLTWEKTAQYDFGVDVGLFKNRLNFVADIYYKYTYDLLLNITLPSVAGNLQYIAAPINQELVNGGSLSNKGVELAVQSKNLVGKFKWNTSLTFNHNDNRIVSLFNGATEYVPNQTSPSVIATGYSVGSFLVYQTNGLIPAGTSATAAANLTPNVLKDPTNANLAAAGQQAYLNPNGGVITNADKVIINNQPLFLAGLTNTFNYKNFDLTIFLYSSVGNKIYNQELATLDLGTGFTNGTTTLLDRYTATNTNTSEHAAFTNPAATLSSKYVEDGSYLRLKNLTLGYTIPTSLLSKIPTKPIQSIRVYVAAQNLLTYTHYLGFDPEVSSYGQVAYLAGIDNGVYPNAKTFLVGANVTF